LVLLQRYKNSECEKEALRVYYFFLYKILVFPFLGMASVQAETCSTHVQVPN